MPHEIVTVAFEQVSRNFTECRIVGITPRKLEQFVRIVEIGGQRRQRGNDGVELLALLAQLLAALLIVPDLRVFQRLGYVGEPL